ncbi:acyltransferase [Pseudomonas gingeri]|uniref:acyltransferase family protein n=1 Tax=Pseudomonas gingeri TaxID=117681 RepID=UPI0015A0CE7E|nr:acyltransferase [Pseudomonas gingeri]NWD71328.1 acyltransferase [Pseudomonas gingeri]
MNTPVSRIIFLDYMRIFAFASVLIGHKFYKVLIAALADPTLHTTFKTIIGWLAPLCYGGAAGVVVFFLTSGYIITHVLRSETPGEFLIKRFFRIYPLYAAAIIIEMTADYYIGGVAIPPPSTLIPRLLLIGDYFGVPTALGGVEWTLRIEVAFYVFMAITHKVGLLQHSRYLPLLYLVASAALWIAPSFPNAPNLSYGYFTLYAPFLFVGSLIYLYQMKMAEKWIAAAVAVLIVTIFLLKIPYLQPAWKDSNYAILAVLVFLFGLATQQHLRDGAILRLLSNMTYSIYLFHNWAWNYISLCVDKAGIDMIPSRLQILIVLFPLCYLLHITMETYGLAAGRRALSFYRGLKSKQPALTEPTN